MADKPATSEEIDLDSNEPIEIDLDEPSDAKGEEKKGEEAPVEKKDSNEKDERSGGSEDYLGTSKPAKKDDDDEEESGYKKRYSDSSREAQKLKKELDELQSFIEGDEELHTLFKDKYEKGYRPTSKAKEGGNEEISALKGEIEELKSIVTSGQSQNNEVTIQSFENRVKEQTGKAITPSMRDEMRPLVRQLVAAKMPLERALRMAYFETYGDTITAEAAKAGEKRALATKKAAEDATETQKGQSKAPSRNVITLTPEEVRQAKKMGVTTQEGLRKFALKLQEVRLMKE